MIVFYRIKRLLQLHKTQTHQKVAFKTNTPKTTHTTTNLLHTNTTYTPEQNEIRKNCVIDNDRFFTYRDLDGLLNV